MRNINRDYLEAELVEGFIKEKHQWGLKQGRTWSFWFSLSFSISLPVFLFFSLAKH
jgi:hypothetical protein